MALPELITPVLSVAGPAALVIVVLRLGPDAILRLLAGAVAVLTRNNERGERCLEVLRILHDGKPDGHSGQASIVTRKGKKMRRVR
jgi:hypothetical protein